MCLFWISKSSVLQIFQRFSMKAGELRKTYCNFFFSLGKYWISGSSYSGLNFNLQAVIIMMVTSMYLSTYLGSYIIHRVWVKKSLLTLFGRKLRRDISYNHVDPLWRIYLCVILFVKPKQIFVVCLDKISNFKTNQTYIAEEIKIFFCFFCPLACVSC